MNINRQFRFEYDISSSCNLNCAGCSHYAPIADTCYVNAKLAEIELTRLSEVLDGNCECIHIMGGEPLLNNEIIDILKTCRTSFPNTEIQVVTNGILLPDMVPEFWKVCHELDIKIMVTIYPIPIKVEKINAFAKTFNVDISIFRNGNKFTRYFLDKNGEQNCKNSYEQCKLKKCPLYRNGKLYPCSIAGCVYKLNKYTNSMFKENTNDYIDIFSDINKTDVHDFLNQEIPFCKYCMTEKWYEKDNCFEWQKSNKLLSEWIYVENK